jgi:hypothetical protein
MTSAVLQRSLLALAVIGLGPWSASALELNQAELARLAAGEEIVKPAADAGRNGIYGGTSLILIDAEPAEIQAAIEDTASYPSIFPMFLSVEIVGKLGQKSIVRMSQGTPVFSLIYHVLVSRDQATHTTRFRLVGTLPHDIDDVVGFWRLFPQPDGRTVVVYSVRARINLGALGLIDRVGQEIQRQLIPMPGHLKSWLSGPGKGRYTD